MTEHWTTKEFRAYLARQQSAACNSSEARAGHPNDVSAKKPVVEWEFHEQVRFFKLVDILGEMHPHAREQLLDVYSTSSGGVRHKRTAGRLRQAGQRKGIPDIECLVPSQGYHALIIELKPEDRGRPTPEQSARILRYQLRGYRAEVIHGWIQAAKLLCEYLELPFPENAATLVELRLHQERLKSKQARGRVVKDSSQRLRKASPVRG